MRLFLCFYTPNHTQHSLPAIIGLNHQKSTQISIKTISIIKVSSENKVSNFSLSFNLTKYIHNYKNTTKRTKLTSTLLSNREYIIISNNPINPFISTDKQAMFIKLNKNTFYVNFNKHNLLIAYVLNNF